MSENNNNNKLKEIKNIKKFDGYAHNWQAYEASFLSSIRAADRATHSKQINFYLQVLLAKNYLLLE